MARHGMSDQGWEFIKHLLPDTKKPKRGRPWVSHRRILDGCFWILRTGAPWRDLPAEFGPWETVYGRFRRWCRDGTIAGIFSAIIRCLEERSDIDWDLWCLDGTIARAARCAGGAPNKSLPNEQADHALGRSKGGFTSKLHVKTDGIGHIPGIVLTAGQCHESTQFEAVMASGPLPILSANIVVAEVPVPPGGQLPTCEIAEQVTPSPVESVPTADEPALTTDADSNTTVPSKHPKAVACDKAYSAQRIRDWCDERGIECVIPTKSNESQRDDFDTEKYGRRNIVERAIGWLKECRRVLSRFEKYALHYLGFINLAIIQRFMNTDL